MKPYGIPAGQFTIPETMSRRQHSCTELWSLRHSALAVSAACLTERRRPHRDCSECLIGPRVACVEPCDGETRRHATKEMHPSLKEIAVRAAAEAERQAIRLALHATLGNKSEAARLLRVDYKTLHLKMKRYGIEAGAFRAS
jgi:DNA-binding NtrC family response regulator